MQACGDQTGEVRHVDPQVGTDLVGDGAEGGEVLVARVADQPATMTFGFSRSAMSRTSSMSMRWSSLLTP